MSFLRYSNILKSTHNRVRVFKPDPINECNFILFGLGSNANTISLSSGRRVLEHGRDEFKFRAYGWKDFDKESMYQIQNTSTALVCKHLLQEPLHKKIANGSILEARFNSQVGYFRVLRIPTGVYSLDDTLGTTIKGIFDIQRHNIET